MMREAPGEHGGTLRERFERCGTARALTLPITVGTREDYKQLAGFHYRANAPGTMTRVLVMRAAERGAADRWLGRGSERCIAVLVESHPSLSCRMRDVALHDRYGSWLTARERSQLMKRELRCISRVVVHPQWRGLGLAVQLVKHALATSTTRFTEALAAMGQVNPFFERAGMRVYARPPLENDERLRAALGRVGMEGCDLARLGDARAKIEALDAGERAFVRAELKRWARRHLRSHAAAGEAMAHHLRLAQGRLSMRPVYYVHDAKEAEHCEPRKAQA